MYINEYIVNIVNAKSLLHAFRKNIFGYQQKKFSLDLKQ